MVQAPPATHQEITFQQTVQRGSKGLNAKRVQEWLNLHGYNVAIDSNFGPASETALKRFQTKNGLPSTGVSDQATFEKLVAPMRDALANIPSQGKTLGQLTIEFAKQHLRHHPREVPGDNRGPWVRLYMNGNEGTPWAWCAGFVCFCLKQASTSLGKQMPFDYTYSCDTLAAFGKQKGIFLAEKDVTAAKLKPGSIFLVRRTGTDWIHTGFVSEAEKESFDTIEGNTNDQGSREGYEVCARIRAYDSKDFLVIG